MVISIENIYENGMLIRYILKPTPDMCLAAIYSDPHSLMYIQNQTPELVKLAISKYGYLIKYVLDQTEELCNIALKQTTEAIKYIRIPTFEMYRYVVQKNGWNIRYILQNTQEYSEKDIRVLSKLAVEQNGSVLQFIHNQTIELCWIAIMQKGLYIDFVKDLSTFIIWFIRIITGKM